MTEAWSRDDQGAFELSVAERYIDTVAGSERAAMDASFAGWLGDKFDGIRQGPDVVSQVAITDFAQAKQAIDLCISDGVVDPVRREAVITILAYKGDTRLTDFVNKSTAFLTKVGTLGDKVHPSIARVEVFRSATKAVDTVVQRMKK